MVAPRLSIEAIGLACEERRMAEWPQQEHIVPRPLPVLLWRVLHPFGRDHVVSLSVDRRHDYRK